MNINKLNVAPVIRQMLISEKLLTMTIFTKPFRVKSNTQMKGSDKKKLKASLKKSFPSLTDDHLNELLPTKDEIVVSKIFTFSEESVLLYIHNKNTIFFEMEKEKQFFPTVYTLWKVPDLFPTLTTLPGNFSSNKRKIRVSVDIFNFYLSCCSKNSQWSRPNVTRCYYQ